MVVNITSQFFPFIYLKSSQMKAAFYYHFRSLKRDKRRNQTLMQNIVQKIPYISINYPVSRNVRIRMYELQVLKIFDDLCANQNI